MAIYHLHVKTISRGSGRSVVAAAAYRTGEKHTALEAAAYRSGDELSAYRKGIKHDYRRKRGIAHKEIILPEGAPREYNDRSTLWNTVELSEKRKDARTAREIEMALPVEFDLQEQIELLREYIKRNFVDKGMCADFAIHDKNDGNPHSHILLTTREVTNEGFGKKNRDWDKVERLVEWREDWARVCNERLAAKGLDERIDHRTLEAQGIDREPTIHEGRNPERAKTNEEIKRRNREREESKARNIEHEKGKIAESIARHLYETPETIVEKTPESIARISPDSIARHMHGLKERYIALDKEITVLEEQTTEDKKRIAQLSTEKKAVLLEYQREKLLADISGDKDKIQALLKQMEPQREPIRERLARIQSERFLDIVTEKNFRAILEATTPEQQRRLVMQRERERARELGRGRERER
ncbi:MAG: MobA/MobL family protein [Clostridiales bacterium]|nr:MobA/MobL family protein [Clostridiales bacterium]